MKTKKRELYEKACEIVDNSRAKAFSFLSVNWIARELEVSVPNLSRAFKEEAGITLREYIARERILCSKLLLEEEEGFTVKEVSEKLDYSSSSYYIRKFKKELGKTPGEFRDSIWDNPPYGRRRKRKKENQ